jgi:hypothetical protein
VAALVQRRWREMVVIVGNSRIYRFPDSAVACEVYDGHAEILVLPERRRFILRLKQDQIERLQQAYPKRALRDILSSYIADGLENGRLQVDEEVA